MNIASRCAGFIHKYFAGRLATSLDDPTLYKTLLEAKDVIVDAYISRDYARAIRLIMDCADQINQYIDMKKPWLMVKDQALLTDAHMVCSMGLNAFRIIMTYLKPVLPQMSQNVEQFLQCSALTFKTIDCPLLDHTINQFVPLMTRVDPANIEAMLKC